MDAYVDARARLRAYVPLCSIALLSTVFGAIGGTVTDVPLTMAVFGLAWGLVAIPVVMTLARVGASSSAWADGAVAATVVVGVLALGGSLQSQMRTTTPELFVASMQTTNAFWFFPILHMLFEWVLLPAAIALNWTRSRRNLLLLTAAIFYAFRVASALYFAPHALDWGQLPIGTPITGELYDDVQTWLRLNWVRFAFQDFLAAILLLLALYLPGSGQQRHSRTRSASLGKLETSP